MFLPVGFKRLPMEVKLMIVMLLPKSCFMNFIYTFFTDSEFCFQMICEKMKEINKTWSNEEKSNEWNEDMVVSLMKIAMYMIHNKIVARDLSDFLDEDGVCYLSELSNFGLLTSCKYMIGHFPSPWIVNCLYEADEGYGLLSECRTKGCAVRKYDGGIIFYCVRCQINGWFSKNIHSSSRKQVDRLLMRHTPGTQDLHLVGYHDHHTMNHKSEVHYREKFGDGDYFTMFILRQKEMYFDGKVGTPEVVDFSLDSDDDDEIRTVIQKCEDKLRERHSKRAAVSTIMPNDSASNITPVPLSVKTKIEPKFEFSEVESMIMSMMETKMADMKTDMNKISEKKSIGDYTRYEYDQDLEEAFTSSGVIVKEGQMFLRPMACTRACDLVPRVTIGDRLNFLIRLHTAIFKIVKNTSDYPKPGIMSELRMATEGELPDDHPSFDLLQIVLADTIDWNHLMVKSNNFLLPVLEQGMRFNERILAACLLSLKGEYFARWTSVMKDCILPSDITDTSRWSDSYSTKASRLITAKRPDLAVKHRQSDRRAYSRKRRDSAIA
jgi:hypothetical protein